MANMIRNLDHQLAIAKDETPTISDGRMVAFETNGQLKVLGDATESYNVITNRTLVDACRKVGIVPVALAQSSSQQITGILGLASGISGGVPYFNANNSLASSTLLTANAVMLGGGVGAAPITLDSFIYTASDPSLLLSTTRVSNTGSFPGFKSLITVTPTSNQAGTVNTTAIQARVNSTGTANIGVLTGADNFATHTGTGTIQAMAGSSNWSQSYAGSGAVALALIGAINIANSAIVGGTVPLVIAGFSDFYNGGIPHEGTYTNYIGYGVGAPGAVALPLPVVGATNRYGYYLNTMAGAATTNDYAFYSLATQPSLFTGDIYTGSKISIGGIFVPTSQVSFVKEASATIAPERSTTAETAGAALNVQSAGSTLGSSNKNGGILSLIGGNQTGSGSSRIQMYTYLSAGAGTTDGTIGKRFEIVDNKIGVFGVTAVVQQTGGQNVTNSVTDSGSTAGVIPDITDGVTYANDYTNLRRALYQIARMLKQDHDANRAFGWLT